MGYATLAFHLGNLFMKLTIGRKLLTLTLLAFLAWSAPAAPPKVILDTDMTGDCDDAGAFAVAHALADNGELEILGCIASYGAVPYIPGCIDAINTYYGRGDLPIGAETSDYGRPESHYVEAIAKDQTRYGHDVVSKADVPDHITVYRQLLAAQPDHSVTIITLGRLKGIYDLVTSPPDAISDLDGTTLVKQKVDRLVCMGGRYPNHDRKRSANFGTFGGDLYTKKAIEAWPLPILFTGFEVGREIMTGTKIIEQDDENPVARAYRLWFEGTKNQPKPYRRPSWDQTAVLLTARGTEPWWDLVTTGYNHIHDEFGINEWLPSPDKDHAYVGKRVPPTEVAEVISTLMNQPPKHNRQPK